MALQLRFLGHAAVLLQAADGTSLLFDPYNPGGFDGQMAYGPIPYAPDLVVCTHGHADHAATADLVAGYGHLVEAGRHGPYTITRHRAWHDEYQGRRRGGAVDLIGVEVDGLRLVHLSDVGHSPGPCCLEALGAVDVLLVPVGGFYTIGPAQAWEWSARLGARLIVPIHYRTPRCDLPLGPAEPFEAYFEHVHHAHASMIEITCSLLSLDHQVVVLDHEL
jgi:L-ascorbate metabolism protein UlaG (beta-lactamase superfamily)